MDVASIVITASIIIIILQIISIVLIAKGKSSAAKTVAPTPAPVSSSHDPRDPRKRRDDSRFNNRKPAIEQRPKPPVPAQPQAVDYVEKSLRDINLRLKNAERDQESARKKIKDVATAPSGAVTQPAAPVSNQPNQNQPRRSDQNSNRPPRRNEDFKRRDRNGRPNNNQPKDRDQSRNSQNERPVDAAPLSQASTPQVASIVMPSIQSPIQAPEVKQVTPIVTPVVEKEVVSIVPENTEVLHGRKVLVRRRILTAEEIAAKEASEKQATAEIASSSQTPAQSSPTAPEPASEIFPNETDNQPRKFGR